MVLSGWRAALRIAWREAWRSKGRSTLVAALIGLPVLALSFAAVTYDSFRLTVEQQLDRDIGAADALVSWEYEAPVNQAVDGLGYQVDAAAPDVNREPVTAAKLQEALPPGTRVVPELRGQVELRTADGIGSLESELADLDDPIYEGRLTLRAGRAPAGDDEVALTRAASRRLDASIGDTVQAADGFSWWRVVGLVEYPDQLQLEALVLHPGDLRAGPALTWLVDTVDPVTWEEVERLNRLGITVQSRAVILDPPPLERLAADWRQFDGGSVDGQALAIGLLVGGLAVLEVVLLAGPAFAVGTRRRQRELALVAVGGGTPAHQRRIVLADGIVLGLIGAVTGIGLGAAAAISGQPLLEEYLYGQRAGGLRLWPQVLAGIALLAILTGLLAALVPAAVAARQNVVMALAGRRGVVRSRKRWLALGLAMVVLGTAIAAAGAWQVDASIVLAGLIVSQLGLVLCTPALVGLISRAGRFLPLAPRIALRDTARNRAAAAPAISAVMAAVAGSLALGMFTNSDQQRYDALYSPGMPIGYAQVRYQVWDPSQQQLLPLPPDQRERVRAALRETLPVDQVIEVRGLACLADGDPGLVCSAAVPTPPRNVCPYWQLQEQRSLTGEEQRAALADRRCQDTHWVSGGYVETIVDDGTLLQALTGASDEDAAAAVEVLRAGGVVVSNPLLIVEGRATVQFWDGKETGSQAGTQLAAPAHALTTGVLSPYALLVSPRLVAAAGFGLAPSAVIGVSDQVPSQAQQDALNAALHEIHADLWAEVERGEYSYEDATAMVLVIAAGVITLGAAGIATGLAAAERRPDLSTLAAVGASPRVRRLLSLSQSGVIAGLGALLGAVAGIAAAVTIMLAMNRRLEGRWPVEPAYPLLIPWQALAIVLVAVPVVAMLGAGLFTRSRLPIERRLA